MGLARETLRTSGLATAKGRPEAYIYAILVDDVIRYVGKGRNDRLYTHVLQARRAVGRCGPDTSGLYPRFHRRLVEAIRAGSKITEQVLTDRMTDKDAYRLESEVIAAFHGARPDQLWNTIDERFMDRRYLPEEYRDPEHPNYRLRRPLTMRALASRPSLVPRLNAQGRACRRKTPAGLSQ